MRISGIVLAATVFFILFSCPGYCGNIERAGELGDDFQKQMPSSKEKPQSGETQGQPQPDAYTAPPEGERTETRPAPQGGDYPLCYNPYTRMYETCYPEGSEYWRERYVSPEFRYWWEHGRACPSGYYFRPGHGCYRY